MQYRNLGRSGLKISPICLGTMMFGGPTDEATSTRIVAKAREAGKIGEILMSKPHVVSATRSLIFITTEVTVDKRCIAMASGVFKILKSESGS